MKTENKNKNLLFWLMLLGSFCVGETFGAISGRMISSEALAEIAGVFTTAVTATVMTSKKVFLSVLWEKAKWAILFYLGGFFRLTSVCSVLFLGVKGYFTGFATTWVLRTGNTALFLYLMLPTALVELPCFFAMVRLGVLHSKRRHLEKEYEKRREYFKMYSLAIGVLFLILIGWSGMESFIFPWIIKTFYA